MSPDSLQELAIRESPDSLQELAIRKIMDARRCFLNSEERHLVNALRILGCDTEGLSLAELPRILREEILRRECKERFDAVTEELFTFIMNTDEWKKLFYSDACIRPSVIATYCRRRMARYSRHSWQGVDTDSDDEEWIETPYYSGPQLEPHPWELVYY